MDILCRCINSAFFLSHDIRRDTRVYLVLLGAPRAPLTLRFEGCELKYLNPDERSAGSLISKALEKTNIPDFEIPSTPGVWVQRGGLEKLLAGKENLVYLREDGEDIRDVELDSCGDVTFVLGDHNGMSEGEEALLRQHGARVVSLGPLSLHADHCIILIHNELDRTSYEQSGCEL